MSLERVESASRQLAQVETVISYCLMIDAHEEVLTGELHQICDDTSRLRPGPQEFRNYVQVSSLYTPKQVRLLL